MPLPSATVSAAAAFASQMLGQVGRAVLLAWLLSPADFGRFLVLRSAASVVALVAQGGLGPVGLRRVSAARARHADPWAVTGRVLGLAARTGAAAATLLALAVRAAGYSWLDAAAIGVIAFATAIATVAAGLGRGFGRTRAIVIIERGMTLPLEAAAIAALWLPSAPPTLTAALVAVAGASLVPAVLLMRLLRKSRVARPAGAASNVATPESTAATAELMAEAWPVTVHGLLARAIADSGLWIVGAWLGAPAAAVYGVGTRLAMLLQMPGAIAGYVLSEPVAALGARGDRRALERLVRRSARLTGATAVAGYSLLALIGADGIGYAFGPVYRTAHGVFLVLGIGQVISAAAGPGLTVLLMLGATRPLMLISVVSAVVTGGGAAVLVPALGAVGAAWAAAAGLVLQSLLLMLTARRQGGVRVFV
jgi:O-antigen/teichoic acid export membrane protein